VRAGGSRIVTISDLVQPFDGCETFDHRLGTLPPLNPEDDRLNRGLLAIYCASALVVFGINILDALLNISRKRKLILSQLIFLPA
jgi:hypothetical protein